MGARPYSKRHVQFERDLKNATDFLVPPILVRAEILFAESFVTGAINGYLSLPVLPQQFRQRYCFACCGVGCIPKAHKNCLSLLI